VHFDLQGALHDWAAVGGVDLGRQVSATLPISLPRKGAGLRIWNVDKRRIDAMRPEARQRWMAENRRCETHAYAPGRIALHSGYLLHQMAPMPGMAAQDERITLQAHAAPGADGWLLYW
jgi:hypothetical protein